jgi:hypothetical protein
MIGRVGFEKSSVMKAVQRVTDASLQVAFAMATESGVAGDTPTIIAFPVRNWRSPASFLPSIFFLGTHKTSYTLSGIGIALPKKNTRPLRLEFLGHTPFPGYRRRTGSLACCPCLELSSQERGPRRRWPKTNLGRT